MLDARRQANQSMSLVRGFYCRAESLITRKKPLGGAANVRHLRILIIQSYFITSNDKKQD